MAPASDNPAPGIRAVIFDLGGVLMTNGRPADAASRFEGADPAVIAEVIMGPHGQDTDHPWHRLERGEISMTDYQDLTRAAIAERGLRPVPRPEGSGTRPDSFAFEANHEMLALVAEVRAAGLRTGMLTNNVREIRPAWWKVADWPALFDDIVDSHEVGVRKPNPAIYHLAAERLGVQTRAVVFLDDLLGNVSGAVAVGMTGVHVTGDGTDAIAEVRRLLF